MAERLEAETRARMKALSLETGLKIKVLLDDAINHYCQHLEDYLKERAKGKGKVKK